MRISDWISDVCSSDLPAPTDGLAHDGLVELQLRPVEQICEVQELQVYGACSTMLKARGVGRTRHLQAQLLRLVNQPHHVGTEKHLVLLVDDHAVGTAALLIEFVEYIRSEAHTSELQSLMRTSYAV